jgi:hypothetical protein
MEGLTGQAIWNLFVFFGILATRVDVRELCGHGVEADVDTAFTDFFLPMGLSVPTDDLDLLKQQIVLLDEDGWQIMDNIRKFLSQGGGGVT